MITLDAVLHWAWRQYLTARTVPEIEYWFSVYALNHRYREAQE